MQHRWLRAGLAALACALGGCGALTQTPYTTPALAVPSHWQGDIVSAQARLNADPWWHAFGDGELDALIDRVLKGNRQLAAAVINLQQAWQQSDLSLAGARPALTLNAGSTANRALRGPASTSHSNSSSAGASYTMDLWGSLASQLDATRWQARASQQDRDNLALQLVATTANLYWQMAYLSAQLEHSAQSIRHAQQTLAIAQARYRLGAISAIGRLAAQASLASQQANRSTLMDQQTRADHAMSLLLGQPPGEHFTASAATLERPLPQVSAGLPAEVLGRRPDLRAAEMRLRASLHQVDSARTSFYPTLSLTGTAGSSSQTLSKLLLNPMGSLAASLAAPFVNWATMQATVGAARSTYEAAAVVFGQTFYQALQEVENALAARDHGLEQAAHLAEVLEAARQTTQRNDYAWRAGSISLQTLLSAQDSERAAQTSLTAARYAQFVNRVTLYQALGGSDRPASSITGSEAAITR